MQEARAGWQAGRVQPWLITQALDAAGLEGPDVDALCLAQEPEVDEWEAGTRYPTFEQLCALAKACGMLPHWFVIPHPVSPAIDRTSLWHHMSPTEKKAYLEAWHAPVVAFTAAAYRAAGVRIPKMVTA